MGLLGIKWVLGLSALLFAATTFDAVYVGKNMVEKTPKVYVQKGDCKLQVVKTYFAGNTGLWADFRVEVSTAYGHGKDTPGSFVLSPSADGTHMNDKPLKPAFSVELKEKEKWETVKSFTLSWDHHGHPHNFFCDALVLNKKP